MASKDIILSVRDLTKVYGKGLIRKKGFRALDGVTIDIGRGTVFGLLGPNGAGKTTFIKILLGLVRGYGGSAQLFGRPPGDPRSRTRAGFLPEAHRLPGYLTGRQCMELFGMMAGASLQEVRKRIPPLLEKVGMSGSADRKVREYSKGMQQRIGLAQSLVHDPEIVFLDEPTDGVDPVGRAAVREMVQELKDRGVTVFINSHLLMEVELICDRVVIMTHGKILTEGSVEDLTPRTGGVRFELREVPDNLGPLLEGLGAGLAIDVRGFMLQVDDSELDATIDRLRAAGVGIRSIEAKRLSLEESFIDLVQKERA